MENNVKILRLKDDLDIICFLEEKEDYTYGVSEPMIFHINNNSNLVMQQWLPLAMLKENRVVLKFEDVLCVMEPNDEFSEFYMNTVERINSANASKPKDVNDEKEYLSNIMDAMDELGNTKNLVLH